ncbi:MAG: PTS sugar transporter subunit IIB [Propioniciclava sp.]
MTAKRILVVCGTGVATSTVVVQKVRAFCESQGFSVTINQAAVADLVQGDVNADFIVATTEVPSAVQVPVIPGLAFLTGLGVNEVEDKIRAQFS